GRVVDQLDRLAKGMLEVVVDPALAEVGRLLADLPLDDRAGKAHGEDIIGPVLGQLDHAIDHLLGAQLLARRKAPGLLGLGALDFDIGAPDVDRKNLHGSPQKGRRGGRSPVSGAGTPRTGKLPPRPVPGTRSDGNRCPRAGYYNGAACQVSNGSQLRSANEKPLPVPPTPSF